MMKKITIILLAIIPAICFSAVYKWVDENGKIHYSDTPKTVGEKPIDLPEATTYSPPPQSGIESSSKEDKKKQNNETFQGYKSISITSPKDGDSIHSAPGNITFNVSIEPAIQEGHAIQIYVDGKKAAQESGTTITANYLDRGSHSVSASVVDGAGTKLLTSPNITVYLHRVINKAK